MVTKQFLKQDQNHGWHDNDLVNYLDKNKQKCYGVVFVWQGQCQNHPELVNVMPSDNAGVVIDSADIRKIPRERLTHV